MSCNCCCPFNWQPWMPVRPPLPPPPDNSCNVVAAFDLFDAESTTNPTTVQPPETVTGTNTSTGALSYQWFVNGASVSTDANLSYAIGTSLCDTSVTIELRAYCGANQSGAFDSATRTVAAECEVACNPVAGFDFENDVGDVNPPSVIPGDTIHCTNTSTGALSYEWFVDGVSVATTQDYNRPISVGDCGGVGMTVELRAYCEAGQTGTFDTFSRTFNIPCS